MRSVRIACILERGTLIIWDKPTTNIPARIATVFSLNQCESLIDY